ncbi:MAG: hypothetical protein HY815_05665 [Candidatus Riflebacteria bacterium]|nr:hypothetical protein [Candidatus Riflebacteria bacterium]
MTGDRRAAGAPAPRPGLTVVEILVGTAILCALVGAILGVTRGMHHQSIRTVGRLSQMQDALLLLETIRLELASLVLNPFEDARDHENNSFVISRPHGRSIQFVTERRQGAGRQRYLVWYDASRPSSVPGCTTLRKVVYRFDQAGAWASRLDRSDRPWPAEWLGPVQETREAGYRSLLLRDMRWEYLVPFENEGRVFFRVKLVLQAAEGGRLLPLTTLVGIQTPDLSTRVSGCPCLFADCYGAGPVPDCHCCSGGGAR